MYKDVLNHANMVHWAELGLVIFFTVFVLTTLWAMTRSKSDIRQWSAIPLSSGPEHDDITSRDNDGDPRHG